MNANKEMNGAEDRLRQDLKNLGINPGDTLMVHSSLKSLGPCLEGGLKAVLEALTDCLPQGNLLLPSLSYEYAAANPVFSVRETPCCVGAIPEAFRKYPGVLRSAHPTHSVCAWGVNASEIIRNHYLDRTPVGENSPFRLLREYNGKILMLGCGLRPNTFMHGVEEDAEAPYTLSDRKTVFIMEYEDGRREEVPHITHNFDGIIQRYDRVSECMPVKEGKVLSAGAYLLDACLLWETAGKKLREEPWFFVDKYY